jgi:hypothetical protein
MNIAARAELMKVLTEISELTPFIRLGQLLTNLSEDVDAPWAGNVREVEDEELLPVAREYLQTLRRLPPESIADQIRGHLESDQYARQAAG